MGKSALQLRTEYENYLDTLGVATLRSLAREIGVDKPTKGKTKYDLIKLMVAILMGEIQPTCRSSRGAPVKAQDISPKILFRLHEIGGKSIDGVLKKVAELENYNVLTVKSAQTNDQFMDTVYHGQLVFTDDSIYVYPLNGFLENKSVILEAGMAENYFLKDGDCISYLRQDNGDSLFVSKIFKINDVHVFDYQPNDCSEMKIAALKDTIPFKENKVLDWFFPIYKGGRCLVVAPAKCGKTFFLKQLSEELSKNTDFKTLALLVEQPNENVFQFQTILSDRNLLWTSYDHDSNEQLFIAEFALKRAKAYAKTGKDVVLILDGLLALAKAYDENVLADGRYLAGGLTAKSLRYVKKFLASARNIDGDGSLTLICSLPIKTGNPDDDLFFAEVSSLFETQIALDLELAKKRVYPAIDFMQSRSNEMGKVDLDSLLGKDKEKVVNLINESQNYKEFFEKIEEI